MPTPDESAVRDTDHLLVRMIQRGQQHVSLLDSGQQHAEHRRRVQAGRRVEVEVQRGTGDHRERELGVGEPEIARVPLDTDRDVGAESREPARGDAREISGGRQPDAFDPVGDRPFEHHALGQHRVAKVNERVHDTQIFVVSAPPMRFAIAVRRRFLACLTAGVDAAAVLELMEGRRLGWSLPGPMYHDADVFALDLVHVWHREWVFAGLVCELAEPGDYLTLQVGDFPLVVIRGGDGELRALHNVCRHRGSVICEEAHGRAGRRVVCPYHQWTYDLAGRHVGGRSMPADVDPAELGLRVAHCATIGGLVYVCVAADPPDVAPLRSLVEPYLAPFDLERAPSWPIAPPSSNTRTGSS